jgi:hypothetical protein
MALLAESMTVSQVAWLKAGVLGDSGKHPWADLLAVME